MRNSLVADSALSVDIGGSHITVGVVNKNTRKVIPESILRRTIDAHASASTIIDAWTAAIFDAKTAWADVCTHLTVSMPGPFDYKNGISLIKGMGKYDALFGLDIRQSFAHKTGFPVDRIFFMNDAEAFLRGEIEQDMGKKHQKVIGLTLGTGLGAAFSDRGRVSDVNLGSSSFLDGIAEDYISSRGVMAYYRAAGGTVATDVKTLASVISKDKKSAKTIRQLSIWLATFLMHHLPTFTPDLIIVGGNIAKSHALFLPEVSRILAEHNMSTTIKVATMGEEAALLGVALSSII